MHPDKNCKFLSPCLLLLTFATLPDFCEPALCSRWCWLDPLLVNWNLLVNYLKIIYQIFAEINFKHLQPFILHLVLSFLKVFYSPWNTLTNYNKLHHQMNLTRTNTKQLNNFIKFTTYKNFSKKYYKYSVKLLIY